MDFKKIFHPHLQAVGFRLMKGPHGLSVGGGYKWFSNLTKGAPPFP